MISDKLSIRLNVIQILFGLRIREFIIRIHIRISRCSTKWSPDGVENIQAAKLRYRPKRVKRQQYFFGGFFRKIVLVPRNVFKRFVFEGLEGEMHFLFALREFLIFRVFFLFISVIAIAY